MFVCYKCGLNFKDTEKYKGQNQCKLCYYKTTAIWREKNRTKTRMYAKKWQAAHPECSHKHKLKYRYNMTVEQYNTMSLSQGGVCAICKQPETKKYKLTGTIHLLSVDHCHNNNKIRGLLCDDCNKAIGLFKENLTFISSAFNYLKQNEHV